jgi:DNA-binding response OmpR family regulator
VSGGRVLLAEDNADMRGYVGRLLSGQGYEVEAVGDGEAALAAARRTPPDLVLSDVMMPRLDGFGLLRALRADPGLRDRPVILLSARAGEESRVEGVDAGADDYLTKPFSYVVLLARLRALLRRGSPERPAVLRHGDLELDPAQRKVTVAGAPVLLTAREFALLEYLLRRPGEVVSKTELLDHVWDAALDTAENAVEVYVGYLRRKIGRERLETVRGAGYRLAAVDGS